MEIQPNMIYMMPQIMGPHYEKDNLPKLRYPRSDILAIQYHTTEELARPLVPNCFELEDNPLVTILFAYHNGLTFMAGIGYNLATVQIAARYKGSDGIFNGSYIPIMFENQTTPIIGGRELLGVPKIYADLPPYRIEADGVIRCEATLWGHFMFGLEIPLLKKQNFLVRQVAMRQINSKPWLAYKYIPSLDGPPDADYPTITRNAVKIKDLWLGRKGKIFFGNVTEQDIGMTINVINNIKALEVISMKQVLHFQGSAILRLDQSRRLN